jgi:L-ascorbate metabolism protein UlaG (beta-lactamase superfamily)
VLKRQIQLVRKTPHVQSLSLVGHSHYDHLMDAVYVAEATAPKRDAR